VIPTFDSFDYFAALLALLVVLVPLVAVLRAGMARRWTFVLAGLYLLFLVAPRLAAFHLVMWLVVAGLQRLVAATAERRHGVAVLWTALVVALAPMIAWKLWPVTFVVDFNLWGNRAVSWSSWLQGVDFVAEAIGLVGLSFATFRAADLLIKTNLGLVERLSPGRVLAFGLFPPLMVVGPIATYGETAATIERRVRLDPARMVDGTGTILAGLTKVFVFAFLLKWSADVFVVFELNPPWRIWVALIAFGWFFYLNFAGYSDVAIGSSTLLGGDVRPNFDHPYLQTTPTAFWNSWHISLTRFMRTNVYTPMVAGRPQRQYSATIVTMVLIGLWHAISWATLVFGLYHGVSLVVHRVVERRRPSRPGRARRIGKSVAVFSWFVLSLPLLQLDLAVAWDFYGALVGA
jgi:alginate O-acetyltransferase complex protein AlgI